MEIEVRIKQRIPMFIALGVSVLIGIVTIIAVEVVLRIDLPTWIWAVHGLVYGATASMLYFSRYWNR